MGIEKWENKMGKKLLILGNGFDLANGLPTGYSDFLEFAKRAMRIYTFGDGKNKDEELSEYKKIDIDSWVVDGEFSRAVEYLKNSLIKMFSSRTIKTMSLEPDLSGAKFQVNTRLDSFYSSLCQNIWYGYIMELYSDNKMRGENWIDFESEISFIIRVLDQEHTSLKDDCEELEGRIKTEYYQDGRVDCFFEICREMIGDAVFASGFKLLKLREKLYDDLESLIYALEIYLTDQISVMPITKKEKLVSVLKPDYVISFNYTDTYERYYNSSCPVCHIHGECDAQRHKNHNNMVLGIDEYLNEDDQSNKVDFAIFKKFIQRIRKKNDTQYAEWAEKIEKSGKMHKTVKKGNITYQLPEPAFSDIYVFGHSLDVTDRDILRRFFMSDVTVLHIFARDKASEGDLIANLLRIMDEEKVVKKSTNNPNMIEFILTD